MKLVIPKKPYAAYLFDMDGTIANSLPLHFEAWNEALAPHGAHMPLDLFYAWGGIPVPRTVELLNETFSWTVPVESTTKAREEAYLKRLASVKSHAAVEHIIREAYGKIPMAVVSGSSKEAVLSTLATLKLLPFFEALVTAEDSAKGKPDPAPFLKGAEKLGVSPSSCLAFEDAEPGIQSATAAGMDVVRIPQRPE